MSMTRLSLTLSLEAQTPPPQCSISHEAEEKLELTEPCFAAINEGFATVKKTVAPILYGLIQDLLNETWLARRWRLRRLYLSIEMKQRIVMTWA